MEHRGNMVMGDTRIEALDNSLFDKLQVFDGDIALMFVTITPLPLRFLWMITAICPILNTTPKVERRSRLPMRMM